VINSSITLNFAKFNGDQKHSAGPKGASAGSRYGACTCHIGCSVPTTRIANDDVGRILDGSPVSVSKPVGRHRSDPFPLVQVGSFSSPESAMNFGMIAP
jgi:hypothetical protein